ncbi:MAG: hypothetical protein JNL12_06625 [Planctomycetes bacterium]|nr:hypothetical protein [Planctomycetota bacterium]
MPELLSRLLRFLSARLLRLLRLDDATADERRGALWTAVAFFFVLFAYYLLRPLRETVGSAFGTERLIGLFTLTFVLTTLLNQPYMMLVRRFPSYRFLPYALHGFAGSFLALAAWFSTGSPTLGALDFGDLRGCSYALFYSWVTAFSVCGVTLVWVHAVEWFSLAQGKRLFALVSVGGSLGAVLGSSLSKELQEIPYATVCLLAAIAIECGVMAWWRSLQACRRMRKTTAPMAANDLGFVAGLVRVVRDPYLRSIALFVLIAAVVATSFYYQRMAVLNGLGEATKRAIEADINLWQNLLCIVLQLFATSRALALLGVAVVLCVMPLASLGGFVAIGIWPMVAVVQVVEILRRMLQFAFDKPARELLYTPLDAEQKYVSKAIVDTAVMRSGDLVGAMLNSLLAWVRVGPIALLAAVVPLLTGWLLLGRWLGRECTRRASG